MRNIAAAAAVESCCWGARWARCRLRPSCRWTCPTGARPPSTIATSATACTCSRASAATSACSPASRACCWSTPSGRSSTPRCARRWRASHRSRCATSSTPTGTGTTPAVMPSLPGAAHSSSPASETHDYIVAAQRENATNSGPVRARSGRASRCSHSARDAAHVPRRPDDRDHPCAAGPHRR